MSKLNDLKILWVAGVVCQLALASDIAVTPETRSLSRQEAMAVVEEDWLYQAGETLERKDVENEIVWARQIASRYEGDAAVRARKALGQLSKLERNITKLKPDALKEDIMKSYLAVRRIKRELLFMDPAVDFDSLVFIDNPYPTAHLLPENRDKLNSVYFATEWNHQSQQRNGHMAVPGGRLLHLKGLHPGGDLRQLAPTGDQTDGAFLRPDVSFDGKRILFSYKPKDGHSYHIYEMNVDGTGLRQITDSEYDDNDPIYLPDGGIMFTSTRGNTTVRCTRYSPSTLISRCDPDGKEVYILSRNNEPDWLPSLLSDGRVVYTRWEYTEKNVMRIQGLWTVNPDGTQVDVLWGNMSVWPDHLASPRQIPGTAKILFSGVGHHYWYNGSVGIIDPAEGREYPDGLVKVTPDVPFAEVGDGPSAPLPVAESDYHASGEWGSYKTPYPLSENLFLVSIHKGAIPSGNKRAVFPGKFSLYLMDMAGNRELVYKGEHNILHAIPVKPRERPPVRVSKVQWPGTGAERKANAPGFLYSTDVYEGTEIPRGLARHVRVIQLDYRIYTSWRQEFGGKGPNRMPLFSATYPSGSSKRILGTVPVNEEGGFMMAVPSGTQLMLQLLDQDYRCIQTMRSFTGAMPGETRGCVGCHEQRSKAPVNAPLQMTPSMIEPTPWGPVNFSYEEMIQPIFDKHCLACHGNKDKPAGKALDLRLTPRRQGQDFADVYLKLIGPGRYRFGLKKLKNYTGAIDISMGTRSWTEQAYSEPFEPMTFFSYNSLLLDKITKDKTNHGNLKLSEDELRMLTAWMDLNSPYRGDDEVRKLPDPDFPGIEHIVPRPLIRSQPDIPRP